MTLKSIFKNTIRSTIDIPQWIYYTQWQRIGRSFFSIMRDAFVIQADKKDTSFEAVVHQLQLDEAALQARQQLFKQLMWFWLFLFAGVWLVIMYLAIYQAWLGCLYMLVLSSMILCQVFRYHFWSVQIEKKRLGCSLQEWWQDMMHQWGLR